MCNDLLNHKCISFHFTKNNMSENYLDFLFDCLVGFVCVCFFVIQKSKDLDLLIEVESLSRGTTI